MNLSTIPGALPLRIRESPTLASLGRTKLTTVGGQVFVDTFFGVFMELSLDGGTSWSPLTPQLVLTSVPEPAPLSTLLVGIALFAVVTLRNRKDRNSTSSGCRVGLWGAGEARKTCLGAVNCGRRDDRRVSVTVLGEPGKAWPASWCRRFAGGTGRERWRRLQFRPPV